MRLPPLVFIDVETTGGSARYGGRITDIGAIRVEDGTVTAEINQLINPGKSIPAGITRLTGITNEMAWSAAPFQDIAGKLEKMLDGAVMVAHNINFDYSFIKSEFERIGVNFSCNRLCSVKLSRTLHPEYRRHGLDHIIERLGVKVKNRHRGYDDAKVIFEMFQHESMYDLNKLVESVFKNLIRCRLKYRINKKQLTFDLL